MADEFPSRALDKFVLRMPDGMRDRIALAAKENGRSMNAEIVQTLEERYPPPIDIDELKDMIKLRLDFVNQNKSSDTMVELQVILEELSKKLDETFPPGALVLPQNTDQ